MRARSFIRRHDSTGTTESVCLNNVRRCAKITTTGAFGASHFLKLTLLIFYFFPLLHLF